MLQNMTTASIHDCLVPLLPSPHTATTTTTATATATSTGGAPLPSQLYSDVIQWIYPFIPERTDFLSLTRTARIYYYAADASTLAQRMRRHDEFMPQMQQRGNNNGHHGKKNHHHQPYSSSSLALLCRSPLRHHISSVMYNRNDNQVAHSNVLTELEKVNFAHTMSHITTLRLPVTINLHSTKKTKDVASTLSEEQKSELEFAFNMGAQEALSSTVVIPASAASSSSVSATSSSLSIPLPSSLTSLTIDFHVNAPLELQWFSFEDRAFTQIYAVMKAIAHEAKQHNLNLTSLSCRMYLNREGMPFFEGALTPFRDIMSLTHLSVTVASIDRQSSCIRSMKQLRRIDRFNRYPGSAGHDGGFIQDTLIPLFYGQHSLEVNMDNEESLRPRKDDLPPALSEYSTYKLRYNEARLVAINFSSSLTSLDLDQPTNEVPSSFYELLAGSMRRVKLSNAPLEWLHSIGQDWHQLELLTLENFLSLTDDQLIQTKILANNSQLTELNLLKCGSLTSLRFLHDVSSSVLSTLRVDGSPLAVGAESFIRPIFDHQLRRVFIRRSAAPGPKAKYIPPGKRGIM